MFIMLLAIAYFLYYKTGLFTCLSGILVSQQTLHYNHKEIDVWLCNTFLETLLMSVFKLVLDPSLLSVHLITLSIGLLELSCTKLQHTPLFHTDSFIRHYCMRANPWIKYCIKLYILSMNNVTRNSISLYSFSG